MTRRLLLVVLMFASVLTGLVAIAGPAAAVRTTGWATWTPITGSSNNYATTMQLPALGFPKATVATDSRGNVALPSGDSTFLGGATDSGPTDVGIKYGSSRGHSYLNLRPKADNATSPSTTTYSFAQPTPDTGWAFVLGDIDADQVQIKALDANGVALTPAQIDSWKTGHNVFNYAGGADVPTWNPATSTLVGNPAAADTDGASAWFEPDVSISSLTFVYTRRAGFPVYQTWFASVARTIGGTIADVSMGGGSCPIDSSTINLVGPHGEQLAAVHPVGGAYSFGQYATQAGYTVSIERPAGCAVVGAAQQTVSTAATDAVANFSERQIIPQPVSGRVTTTAGQPVAGVEITLTPPGGGTAVITTTAADGSYLFDNNAEQPGYTVAVSGTPTGYTPDAPSSRAVDIAPGTPVTGVDFQLSEFPTVSGVVRGGGDPLGGVSVTLTPSGGGTANTTVTRGDGSYDFAHVPAGTYEIAVTPPAGYQTVAPRAGVLVAGTDVTGQNFALSRPGALGGAVTVAGTAAARPGATITVAGPGGARTLSTDSAGAYFLDGLAAGTYTITLSVPDGFGPVGVSARTVTITTQGEIRGDQDFVIEAVFPVSGTVEAGGDPVSDAVIRIDSAAATMITQATTAVDGTFATAAIPAGTGYRATVTPPPGFVVSGPATVTFSVSTTAVTGIDFDLAPSAPATVTPPSAPTTVSPPPASEESLAATGPHTGGLSVGLGLIGIGALLTAATRRRRRS